MHTTFERKTRSFQDFLNVAQLRLHLFEWTGMKSSRSRSRNKVKLNAGSTRAHPVEPDRYVSGVVKVRQRRHLLKPCPETNNAFSYLLAYTAKRRKVDVCTVSVMSNHYRIVIHDTEGAHPDFFMDLNRMMAQFTNARWGTDGSVFQSKPQRCECIDAEGLVDEIAQTLVGPVLAGGTQIARDWPGLRTTLGDMGRRVIRGTRPKHVFDRQNKLPRELSIKLTFPKLLEARFGSRKKARTAIRIASRRHAKRARQEMKCQGIEFLGKSEALHLDPTAQNVMWRLFDRRKSRLLTLGLSTAKASEVRLQLKRWKIKYVDCRHRLLNGAQDILWPFGTWAMVRLLGQKTGPPPLCC